MNKVVQTRVYNINIHTTFAFFFFFFLSNQTCFASIHLPFLHTTMLSHTLTHSHTHNLFVSITITANRKGKVKSGNRGERIVVVSDASLHVWKPERQGTTTGSLQKSLHLLDLGAISSFFFP